MDAVQFNLNMMWTVLAALLVFLMQAGFTALEAGLVRAKNSINVVMKNMVDITLVSIVFLLIGFPIMFGDSQGGWYGTTGFFLSGFLSSDDPWNWTIMLFQIVFAGTACTIVSGAIAERATFISYILVTLIISVFIYPLFGHWVWGNLLLTEQNGWLGALGFMDFAGSTVVHSLGAWVALAGIIIIGPRVGKYKEDGSVEPIQSSNLPFAAMGVFLLWFGWFGFNAGSTTMVDGSVPLIALNTLMAGAGGGFGALLVSYLIVKNANVEYILNGVLAGLVSITAGCNVVEPLQSVVIGLLGGIVMVIVLRWIDLKLKLDDAVGAVAVHGFCGVWGTLAIPLFASEELLSTGSRMQQFGVQLLGVGVGFVWAFGLGLIAFWLLKITVGVRVSPDQELMGLNVSEHGAKIALVDTISAMREIASSKGDLSRNIPVNYGEDTAQVNEAFNQMIDSLNEIVSAVQSQARVVHQTSNEMLGQITTIYKRMDENAESISHTNSGIQEIRAGIELSVNEEMLWFDTIRRSVDGFQLFTERMRSVKEKGVQVEQILNKTKETQQMTSSTVQNSTKYMKSVKSFVEEVSQMLQMTYQVSEQIDLLSLNARIEASRDTNNGRGFAVVAQEIKKLSDQTKDSLRGLNSSIENHMKQTIDGIDASEKAGTYMEHLSVEVNEMLSSVSMILEAIDWMETEILSFKTQFEKILADSDEMQANHEQLFENLQEIAMQLDNITGTNDLILQEVSSMAEEAKRLYEDSDKLIHRVGSFKTRSNPGVIQ